MVIARMSGRAQPTYQLDQEGNRESGVGNGEERAITYSSYSNPHCTGYKPRLLNEVDRHRIQRELNAFTFGNPQLLIQQVALNRTLQGHVVGQDGSAEPRHAPSLYHHLKIAMLDEQAVQEVAEEIRPVYQDIEETLGLPIAGSDYQALARWSAFLSSAWDDIKQWRSRPEYKLQRLGKC
jgi:hypothetical protein